MRYIRKLLLATLVFIFLLTYFYLPRINLSFDTITIVPPTTQPPLYDTNTFDAGSSSPDPHHNYTLTIVTGHLPTEDVSWLSPLTETHPHISTSLYPINTTASTTPNKGHESIIYLTYILDHYSTLPDVVLFIHPHRKAWHNNILNDVDMFTSITRLKLPHVMRQGYFNTRCHLDPGCPGWLRVDRSWFAWDLKRKPEEPYLTSSVFGDMHGDVPVPAYISQPCCAQFAVSGARIRSRSREFYQRYYDWILRTELDDATSGRLMEYSWQYIFTGLWEWCPSMQDCYCGGYGVCFEGREEGMWGWLRLLKVKERADEKLAGLRDRGRTEGAKWESALGEVVRIGEMLTGWREEAVRRGGDMGIREREGGGAG